MLSHYSSGTGNTCRTGSQGQRRVAVEVVEEYYVCCSGAGRTASGATEPLGAHRADIEAALPLDIPAHHLGLYASHPMGTNRMGANPRESVVDPEGRVWGWRNLHVADASIFPTSLGVNPQLTIMAMCTRIAERLLEAFPKHRAQA